MDHLRDHGQRYAVLQNSDASTSAAATKAVRSLATDLEANSCQKAVVLIRAVALGKGQLQIDLDRDALAEAMEMKGSALSETLCRIIIPMSCKRRGVEMRIIAGDRSAAPDQTLISALCNAHQWADALKSGEALQHLAQRVGYSERYIRRIISLISLSPKIQSAILEGKQPGDLTLETLVRGSIPLDWSQQDQLFSVGF